MSLEVKNVTFRYGKKEPAVLEAFSAAFQKGKITAVLGANGTGKTTLGKLIMGILTPEEGETLLEGENMEGFSLAQRGRNIGYVMQNPARQIFSVAVREEVEYGLSNLGLCEEEIQERREDFLKLFDLQGLEEAFPFHLSHGEKQRLVLAAVLAMEPGYLVLDEPTTGLDRQRKEMLKGYLKKVCEEKHCGILIISHDWEFVESCAHEKLFLGGESDVFSG